MCPDGDLGARTCVERPLPDGSKLIIDDTPLQSGGRDYAVDYLGVDETSLSVHLSNLRDPKAPPVPPSSPTDRRSHSIKLVEIVAEQGAGRRGQKYVTAAVHMELSMRTPAQPRDQAPCDGTPRDKPSTR